METNTNTPRSCCHPTSIGHPTPVGHKMDVDVGADNGDGTHEIRISYDERVAFHIRLTRADLSHLRMEFAEAWRTVFDREVAVR